MHIYHIVLPEIWNSLDSDSDYTAESLKTEGFIHCSYENQLDGVLGRYYANAKEVVILELDTDKLTSRLVEEPSTNNEIYPHIYGLINRDSIVGVEERQLST
jgi:uncharacterized protein (DUF952 family)